MDIARKHGSKRTTGDKTVHESVNLMISDRYSVQHAYSSESSPSRHFTITHFWESRPSLLPSVLTYNLALPPFKSSHSFLPNSLKLSIPGPAHKITSSPPVFSCFPLNSGSTPSALNPTLFCL